ncbi:hypothetical protein BGZ60DRAFT_564533 [Tricladium varicosporioides]|nr:hypothetical protein BGZ60DRAFT_564533 [Hymenoscyphus varicosporioides]
MPSAQENFKLLALVIKDLKAEGVLGKVDFDNITKELGLPSVGATKKRWSRLMADIDSGKLFEENGDAASTPKKKAVKSGESGDANSTPKTPKKISPKSPKKATTPATGKKGKKHTAEEADEEAGAIKTPKGKKLKYETEDFLETEAKAEEEQFVLHEEEDMYEK